MHVQVYKPHKTYLECDGVDEMSITEIKIRIAEIDAKLDDDNLSDAEFDALEAEARRLTAELGCAEKRAKIEAINEINANEWVRNFLSGFDVGTRVITNRQAECFRRINQGKPFRWNGAIYECSGPNYRVGFSYVIVSIIANAAQLVYTKHGCECS